MYFRVRASVCVIQSTNFTAQDDYVTLATNEASEISGLIAGYIDIQLKRRKDGGGGIQPTDDLETAAEELVAPIRSVPISV